MGARAASAGHKGSTRRQVVEEEGRDREKGKDRGCKGGLGRQCQAQRSGRPAGLRSTAGAGMLQGLACAVVPGQGPRDTDTARAVVMQQLLLAPPQEQYTQERRGPPAEVLLGSPW